MEKFFIPRVTYDIASLDMEAELFYTFSTKHRDRWGSVFDRVYPELLPMISAAKDETEAKSRCEEFVHKLHDHNSDAIETGRTELQTAWDAVGSDFLKTLAEHFETEWPITQPAIVGHVSVLPVFPRFLDTFSFCVGYKDLPNMIEISAHEILHFLWFKKWSEVFPEMSSKTYNSPHLVWRLSEIIDPIILQCHPKIKELIKPQKWGYHSFTTIKIGDISMTDYFKAIYENAVQSGAPFADVVRLLWIAVQQHEAEVSVF
jgi:hypothetical protein